MERLDITIRDSFAVAQRRLNDQPWRIVSGLLLTVVPQLMLALLFDDAGIGAAAAVFVATTAISTYLAGWTGAAASLISGGLFLEMQYVGDRWEIDSASDQGQHTAVLLALLSSLVVAWIVQRIKRENLDERQSSLAVRSAATALSAIESLATANPTLDSADRSRLYEATLRALVGINRAHAGLLFLKEDPDAPYTLVASYGFGRLDQPQMQTVDQRSAFFGEVLAERRVRTMNLTGAGDGRDLAALKGSNIRSLAAAPIVAPDGDVLGLLAVGLLVGHEFRGSEVKRLEALANQVATILQTISATGARELMLREAQNEIRRLEELIAALPEAVVVADPDGEIVAANDAASLLFGVEGVLQLNERLVLETDTDQLPDTPMQSILAGARTVDDVELIAIDDDGGRTPVLASATGIYDATGNLAAVVGAFRDIGPLKEASRIKDEFVSVVSHELRSPLTPIRGFVQLVARELEREGGHETQVAWLHSISGHVDRMTRLVDDLLDVSGLRSGALEIKTRPTDLFAICRDVITVRSATALNQSITLNAESARIVGNWDPARLQQIVDNLIGNAIKYGKDDGVIKVSVKLAGDKTLATLIVEDDGLGIDSGDFDRLFGPFVRSKRALTSQTPGLGLGLYICRELVAAHDGSIVIGRSDLGGASVTVQLPTDLDQETEGDRLSDSAPDVASLVGQSSVVFDDSTSA